MHFISSAAGPTAHQPGLGTQAQQKVSEGPRLRASQAQLAQAAVERAHLIQTVQARVDYEARLSHTARLETMAAVALPSQSQQKHIQHQMDGLFSNPEDAEIRRTIRDHFTELDTKLSAPQPQAAARTSFGKELFGDEFSRIFWIKELFGDAFCRLIKETVPKEHLKDFIQHHLAKLAENGLLGTQNFLSNGKGYAIKFDNQSPALVINEYTLVCQVKKLYEEKIRSSGGTLPSTGFEFCLKGKSEAINPGERFMAYFPQFPHMEFLIQDFPLTLKRPEVHSTDGLIKRFQVDSMHKTKVSTGLIWPNKEWTTTLTWKATRKQITPITVTYVPNAIPHSFPPLSNKTKKLYGNFLNTFSILLSICVREHYASTSEQQAGVKTLANQAQAASSSASSAPPQASASAQPQAEAKASADQAAAGSSTSSAPPDASASARPQTEAKASADQAPDVPAFSFSQSATAPVGQPAAFTVGRKTTPGPRQTLRGRRK